MAKGPELPIRGGYDQEFIGEVVDRFICQICSKVLAEPHLAVCCGQHFCESCLIEWFKKHSTESCPHCRAKGKNFNHVINKGLRSEISLLKIRCSNWKHGKGCDWIGELGQLKNHLESEKGCGFVLVTCPNKCVDMPHLKRMDIDEHLRSNCILRPHQCEYCGFKNTYYAITGDDRRARGRGARRSRNLRPGFRVGVHPHCEICPEFPLVCPNLCGAKKIRRKDMEHHCKECPLERVECPFLEAGCKKKVTHSQLDEHLASSQEVHLLMVMKDYKETKHKLHETEDKLSSAIATIRLLQDGTGANKDASSLVIDHSQRLSKEGDFISVIVPKISKVAQSGKVWYSPLFFYREGYKLCLALHIHSLIPRLSTPRCPVPEFTFDISVALCLLRGEYDYRFVWPLQECSATGHDTYNIEEIVDQTLSKSLYCKETRFCVCSLLQDQDRPTAVKPIELKKFDRLHIPKGNINFFANDNLVLKIVSIHDGCVLQVGVI